MDKRNFAFDKVNFILLAIGMAVVIVGFILMSGPGSSETTFDPDIFSVRRIKVAPVVCLFGFLFIIYAILRKPAYVPSDDKENSAEANGESMKPTENPYKID
ncbi:MAG: DUF3098 domain-containing protein [Paraprevotella sp.]|nr:DUF3098 domain-containing protein [Paraprevotella sp.]